MHAKNNATRIGAVRNLILRRVKAWNGKYFTFQQIAGVLRMTTPELTRADIDNALRSLVACELLGVIRRHTPEREKTAIELDNRASLYYLIDRWEDG